MGANLPYEMSVLLDQVKMNPNLDDLRFVRGRSDFIGS